jgi:hypothetical protein
VTAAIEAKSASSNVKAMSNFAARSYCLVLLIRKKKNAARSNLMVFPFSNLTWL